jgi:hypothetical protein
MKQPHKMMILSNTEMSLLEEVSLRLVKFLKLFDYQLILKYNNLHGQRVLGTEISLIALSTKL